MVRCAAPSDTTRAASISPPTQACDGNTPRPRAEIVRPRNEGDALDRSAIEIWGTALGPNYQGYQVEYGLGENPGGWGMIQERRPESVQDGRLAVWDASQVNYSGPVTIRVVVFGPDNPFTPENDPVLHEGRTVFNLQQPTATPTQPSASCSPAYPTVCIPPPPPDLNCGDIPYRRFQVLAPDPHNFDSDGDGIGCESG